MNCFWCWESNPYGIYDWTRCDLCEEPACSQSCLTDHMKESHGQEPPDPDPAMTAKVATLEDSAVLAAGDE